MTVNQLTDEVPDFSGLRRLHLCSSLYSLSYRQERPHLRLDRASDIIYSGCSNEISNSQLSLAF